MRRSFFPSFFFLFFLLLRFLHIFFFFFHQLPKHSILYIHMCAPVCTYFVIIAYHGPDVGEKRKQQHVFIMPASFSDIHCLSFCVQTPPRSYGEGTRSADHPAAISPGWTRSRAPRTVGVGLALGTCCVLGRWGSRPAWWRPSTGGWDPHHIPYRPRCRITRPFRTSCCRLMWTPETDC